jgi:transposase
MSMRRPAVSPHDGVLDTLVLPTANTEARNVFLAEVAQRHADEWILMVLEGAGWHRAGDLVVPTNVRLQSLPPRSPELNPTEHLWEELREKWLGNRFFENQEEVDRQVEQGLAALEQDAARVASLAGFDWIRRIPLTVS